MCTERSFIILTLSVFPERSVGSQCNGPSLLTRSYDYGNLLIYVHYSDSWTNKLNPFIRFEFEKRVIVARRTEITVVPFRREFVCARSAAGSLVKTLSAPNGVFSFIFFGFFLPFIGS